MKTKNLLQTTGLTLLMVLLVSFFTHAQIPLKGLFSDNEGVAIWDADGSGPEPEGYAHIHPWTFESSFYYAASRDFVDANPDAALGHFTGTITDFPLFEQALSDNGFTLEQVRIKYGLTSQKGDIEGEDWFTIDDRHYYNRYDGNITIELNGEPMISAHINFNHVSKYSGNTYWETETNFSTPKNGSEGSSPEVQNVAAAFITDMGDDELRLTAYCTPESQMPYGGNGRTGYYVNIDSGYIEKGLPQLPFTGLATDHEGVASWNADGSGPEPENYGHTFSWGGNEYQIPYYNASRDYDEIDPDPNAGLGHFTDDPVGFPNLMVQLQYRGYTLDQLQLKSGLGTLGNDAQGFDWDLEGNIHWWNSYGNTVTFEIDGEPIIEYVIDTNFNVDNMNTTYWSNHSTFSSPVDISEYCSNDAQYVAHSFFKDLSGHSIRSYLEGIWSTNFPDTNGRVDGRFDELTAAYLEMKQPEGTHIWGGDVSGTWTLDDSPYIIMDEIYVPDGEVLTINPGVEVKFMTTKAFGIHGCIHAEGTSDGLIHFTAYDESVPWGGMEIHDNDPGNEPISLKYCIFEHAYAYNPDYLYGYNCGGAIRVDNYEQIEIDHCTFRYNGADNSITNPACGGAVLAFKCSFPISHCIFHDNYSDYGGALAILDTVPNPDPAHPVIDNCLFYNNESTSTGGAIFIYTNCYPHFVNCTFADNHTDASAGGAVEMELGGETTFTNCIFWGNTAANGPNQINVWPENPPALNIYHCDVEGDTSGITPGFQGDYVGNINLDPIFQTYGNYQFVPDTLLAPTRNIGTQSSQYLPANYSFPLKCLCGNTRILGGGVDMGCYEAPFPVGINESFTQDDFLINIFPNPINSNPTIEFYLEYVMPVEIAILDIQGRMIHNVEIFGLQSGNNKYILNAENFSAGIYFCRLQTGNITKTRKIIKLD